MVLDSYQDMQDIVKYAVIKKERYRIKKPDKH